MAWAEETSGKVNGSREGKKERFSADGVAGTIVEVETNG